MKKIKIICIVLALVLAATGCALQKDGKSTADGGNASTTAELKKITDDEALAAIRNYCYKTNPELKEDVDSKNGEIYWDISSSDEKEIVVLYHSYTSALTRYYIDRVSGYTYVTEYVKGITEEEQRNGISFNLRDYIS